MANIKDLKYSKNIKIDYEYYNLLFYSCTFWNNRAQVIVQNKSLFSSALIVTENKLNYSLYE